MVTKWPWDMTINTSKAALERCMRALLLTESHVTDTFITGAIPSRSTFAYLRVHIPAGKEKEFEQICSPMALTPPTRVQVGMEIAASDEHPGHKSKARNCGTCVLWSSACDVQRDVRRKGLEEYESIGTCGYSPATTGMFVRESHSCEFWTKDGIHRKA